MAGRQNAPPNLSFGHDRNDQPLDVFSTSTEELDLAVPPYASTHNLHVHNNNGGSPNPPASPAYTSRVNLGETLMDDNRKATEELHKKAGLSPAGADPRPSELDGNAHPSGPRVHYSADQYQRQGSTDMYHPNTHSRPASIATTDTDLGDDEENYDWSGEEDLVDQEAKFEARIGNKKKRGWGFKR